MCLFLLFIKFLMIAVRKINILDSPTTLENQTVKSLRTID